MVQALRDRQIVAWAGLEKGPSVPVALVMMALTPLLAYGIWFPLFARVTGIDLPEFFKQTLVAVAVGVQFFSGLGNNATGTEKAQKFMGKYTGVSFSSGIYLLPRFPLPFITLFLFLSGSPIAKYFAGWVLEDEVYVNDKTLSLDIVGLTLDGRVRLTSVLVLRIANAAVYLYQTKVNTDESQVLASITAQSTAKIQALVIATGKIDRLYQGSLQGSEELPAAITEACSFVKDYGLMVVKVLHPHVEILSKQVEHAFDRAQSKEIFVAGAKSLAETWAAYRAALPADTSEEAALMMFNADRLDQGLAPVSLNVVKFK